MSSPRLLGCRSLPLRHLGSQRGTRIKLVFGKVLRHHCLHFGHDLNVISFIRSSSVPFPERLEYHFRVMLYLSGYEDLIPSGSDQFTKWGKMSPHEISAEHVVDIHKVVADFRDPFERNQSSSSQSFGVNKLLFFPITCAEKAQHLQLQPWAPTWKGRRT